MPHKKKPGIAVIISIGKKPKPDMKKYAGDAMPNAMNKAWKVLKIQDWRADNPRLYPSINHIQNPPQRTDFQQAEDDDARSNNRPLLDRYQLQNPTPTPPDAPLQNPKPPSRAFDPEAIARINAQNDEARRALRGGE